MAETQVQPDQGEEKEPWDYQEEGGEEGGGQEPQARRIQPPPAEGGGEPGGEGATEESSQMEQTFPPPAEQVGGGQGGEGGGAQEFLAGLGKVLVPILIEVGMVLLKKAAQSGLINEGEFREIEERHGIRVL